jgi:predicted enzyme related to lactoylglutathione lyase
MKVTEIAFTLLPDTSLQKARQFYEGVVGLTPTHVFTKDAACPFALEPHETPVCRMAVVTDPDGNFLMIHKQKKKGT